MGTIAHLIAAKDRNGRFSGYYKCSHCVAEFRPNSNQPREIASFFAGHVRISHPIDKAAPGDIVQTTGQIENEDVDK